MVCSLPPQSPHVACPQPDRPANYTNAMLAALGFRVEETNLGPDCSSVIDYERRIVFVGRPLRKDHKFWKLARALGAIRLAEAVHTLNAAEAVRWCDRYARLLLLPEAEVIEHLASLRPDCIGDALVKAIAIEFTVPIYVASARLQELSERKLREIAA